ncbi:MAG: Nif3-like dinuclear metal center hexameric protein [Clostridiales bacterium]|nr:Nif3-like dinuclear metal center hexameric protein [Clostridiales bacterium]
MAKLKEIISVLEEIAPPFLALSFDNAGLNIGDKESEITGITVCLDATEAVVDEAINNGSNLIVSHHPVIFAPIKNLNDAYENYRTVTKAIKNDINVYSMHTNLDSVAGGVNDSIADLLGIKNKCVIDELDINAGIGRVGDITPITVGDLAQNVEKIFSFPVRVIAKDVNEKVCRIAVVNGSGADIEYIDKAKKMGATCFITSEIKHHVALYAKSVGMNMIESGHYATEHFYIDILVKKISDAMKKAGYNFSITVSEKESNPFIG